MNTALARIDASIAKMLRTDREREAAHKNFTTWQQMVRLQRAAEDAAYADNRSFTHI